LVIAIEALIEKSNETCEACGNKKWEITGKFRMLINKLIPSTPDSSRIINCLYRIRSSIAHGDKMFTADIEPWKQFPNPKSDDEGKMFRFAYVLVGVALYNWLWMDLPKLDVAKNH